MCGISGFIDFNKKTDLEVLEKMNRIMAHRGPDGEGYGMYETADAKVGLGHRRLSIIDLIWINCQNIPFVIPIRHLCIYGVRLRI